MINLAPQIKIRTNRTSKPIAFSGSYAQNLKTTTELMQKLADKNIENPNRMVNWLLNPLVKFRDDAEKSYFTLRKQFAGFKIEAMREGMHKSMYKDYNPWADLYEKLVLQTKVGLCGELSRVLNNWLVKAGVSSFVTKPCALVPKRYGDFGLCPTITGAIDHRFVVVSDRKFIEFGNFGDVLKDRSAIIADPLHNKVFTNPAEAAQFYGRTYGLTPNHGLGEFNTYQKKAGKVTKAERSKNETLNKEVQTKLRIIDQVMIEELKKRRPLVRKEMFQESLNHGFADYKDF